MAKKKVVTKPTPAWVSFERDPKTGTILLTRKRDTGCYYLQFPRPVEDGDKAAVKEARLLFGGEDASDLEVGLILDYSDVQWLAQALPELLNEMERAGVEE